MEESSSPLPIDPIPPLRAADVRGVLEGTASLQTATRVRRALVGRLSASQSLPAEVRQALSGLEASPENLPSVLGRLRQSHSRVLASHTVFRDLAEMKDFLGLEGPAREFTARRALVVGGLHGSETSGVAAAQIIAEERSEDHRVKVFSRGNPWAVEQGTRRSPADLNRLFPGDPSGAAEDRRAHQLFEAARDADVLIDMHEALGDWWTGRTAGRLCLFYPNPRTLALLERIEPVLKAHNFGLVPYRRYPGTLVQESGDRLGKAALLFEVPLTLPLEARVALQRELANEALDAAFNPPVSR